MLIICATNISTSGDHSQSIMAAMELKRLLTDQFPSIGITDLRDYSIDFCIMCEKCADTGKCCFSDDFNRFKSLWDTTEDVVIISPHYAAVPAKLTAIMEKLQEISYLKYCTGVAADSPKRITIIAHGGMTEGYDELYKAGVITPLSNMLKAMGHNVLNDQSATPLCFGVKAYHQTRDDNSHCFRKENDTSKCREIILKATELISASLK